MKYLSIDIETTGLDSEEHSVIEFAAVLEDTNNILPLEELPSFSCLVEHHTYKGTPYALAMHKEIFTELALSSDKRTRLVVKHYQLAEIFHKWLSDNGLAGLTIGPIKIIVAGKNFGTFDTLFLENLPNWDKYVIILQRILDPAILFWEPFTDEALPNLSECKKRAGLSSSYVAHTAKEDALDVIEVLRTKYK